MTLGPVLLAGVCVSTVGSTSSRAGQAVPFGVPSRVPWAHLGPGCQGAGSLSPHLIVTSLTGQLLHLYHSASKNHTHTATGEEYLTFLTKKKS